MKMFSHAWYRSWSVVMIIFGLQAGSGGGLAAQAEGLPPCPFPVFEDGEDLIEFVERVAAGDVTLGRRDVRSAMYPAVSAPFTERICGGFSPGADRRAAMIRLLEYARDHEDEVMADRVLEIASSVAYFFADELGWSPTDLLFETLGDGRTQRVRARALWLLFNRASEPGIRVRLLALARASVGPPRWRDLPVYVAENLSFGPSVGAELLWSDLHGAPDLVRNPRARWQVECWEAQDRGPPMRPDDPCHPGNAPPRVGGN